MSKITEGNILLKNNKLVQARYDINAMQNKLFQMILFNLQKTEHNNQMICVISIEEIQQIVRHKGCNTPKEIQSILRGLRKATICFKEGSKWHDYGYIDGSVYDENTREFTITAKEKVYELLHSYVTTGFTPVNMELFYSFKSFFTQRLYELLRQWSNTKDIINIPVQELRECFMLEDKYSRYVNFKKRVIIPAIEELNSTKLMYVQFADIKEGKKVVSINFMVTDKDDRNMEIAKQISHDKKIAKQEEIFKKQQSKTKNNKLIQPKTSPDDIAIDVDVLESKPKTKRTYNKTYNKNANYRRSDGSRFIESCPSRERSDEQWKDLEEQLLGWK